MEEKEPTRLQALVARIKKAYDYCTAGVWRDTRTVWKVKAVKIANLSVRGFLDADLQTQACAMTFRMMLAIVPALALMLAIGRGFGLQDLMQNELMDYLPSQRYALETAFTFVDSYLSQANSGIFIGVGIVFLLWTVISLLMSVEDAFNSIWRVRAGRSIWRKITDYVAILLVLPVLLICSAGLSLLMSSTLRGLLDFELLAPAVDWILDLGSLLFTALFFVGAYMLIPNTKVRFANAAWTGLAVAIAFQILQWLFVSGQMYVTRYNAIYGSFSFVPLLLIWLQLVWLITLIGALLCYASQNAGQFNYYLDVEHISLSYERKISLAVMAIVAKRFARGMRPLGVNGIAVAYGLPVSLVTRVTLALKESGLISDLAERDGDGEHPVQPAFDVSSLTCGEVIRRLQRRGESEFIPGFDTRFAAVESLSSRIFGAMTEVADSTSVISLDIEL